MFYLISKYLITAGMVVLISELAKKAATHYSCSEELDTP